jgi:DNA-binding transcriptional regulator GbsR (MarR family)
MSDILDKSPSDSLSPWEQALIDFFMQVAEFLGLPKSVGQIFGLLYASEQPLSIDDIVERLQISRGSASTGLNYLRRFDAVRTTFVLGDRREFYQAETDTQRIAQGFLADQVDPDIQTWGERLRFGRGMLKMAGKMAAPNPAFAMERLDTLEKWHGEIASAVALMHEHFRRPPTGGGDQPTPGEKRPRG